ncbi:MAG: phosphoenolpyruvate synthase, partial [Deltaproteobacteria bacterium]|nr:phosphoenolpyruvate synthase [Deltaproteobacteria bacterium]
ILHAVREVWTSPFSERSFRWRQAVLINPEHVYPSVLLHRTVPSEISGVVVTADLETGEQGALTVSVSEGVAAVVDGGAPETVVLLPDGGMRLMASSRTATRKVVPLPPGEGVEVTAAQGRDPLLGDVETRALRAVAAEVLAKMPPRDGLPWDIELGFAKGTLYLMQIRPLRTSRAAGTHPYLRRLDEGAALAAEKIDLAGLLP